MKVAFLRDNSYLTEVQSEANLDQDLEVLKGSSSFGRFCSIILIIRLYLWTASIVMQVDEDVGGGGVAPADPPPF